MTWTVLPWAPSTACRVRRTVDGNVKLSSAAGDLTIRDVGIENEVEGNHVNLILRGDDAMLTIDPGANIRTLASAHNLWSDKIDLQGSVTAPGQNITLMPDDSDEAIDVGSTTDATADTLEISDAELDRIASAEITVGCADAGQIHLSQAITPAVAESMHLVTAGGVTQAAPLTVGRLSVWVDGTVALNDVGNDVDQVAIDTASGDVWYTDADDFEVTSVGRLHGVVAHDGKIELTAGGDVTISDTLAAADIQANYLRIWIEQDEATLTVAAGARVDLQSGPVGATVNALLADNMRLDGEILAAPAGMILAPSSPSRNMTVDLGATTDAAADTLELSAAELDRITADTLVIAGGGGHAQIVVSATISPEGVNLLELAANDQITQSAAGAIHANNLSLVVAYGQIMLDTNPNEVENLAVRKNFSGYTGDLAFRDATGLTVTSLANSRGITFPGGNVTLIAESGDVLVEDTSDPTDIDATGSILIWLQGDGAELTLADEATIESVGGRTLTARTR